MTVSPSTAANEYYVGFLKNYRGPGNMTLFITTTESVSVPFTVSSSTGQIYSGNATNNEAIDIILPSSFAVLDNTMRDKGVWVHATDASKKLTVHGMNYASCTADGLWHYHAMIIRYRTIPTMQCQHIGIGARRGS